MVDVELHLRILHEQVDQQRRTAVTDVVRVAFLEAGVELRRQVVLFALLHAVVEDVVFQRLDLPARRLVVRPEETPEYPLRLAERHVVENKRAIVGSRDLQR